MCIYFSRSILTKAISPEVSDKVQQYLPSHGARITVVQMAAVTGKQPPTIVLIRTGIVYHNILSGNF